MQQNNCFYSRIRSSCGNYGFMSRLLETYSRKPLLQGIPCLHIVVPKQARDVVEVLPLREEKASNRLRTPVRSRESIGDQNKAV